MDENEMIEMAEMNSQDWEWNGWDELTRTGIKWLKWMWWTFIINEMNERVPWTKKNGKDLSKYFSSGKLVIFLTFPKEEEESRN